MHRHACNPCPALLSRHTCTFTCTNLLIRWKCVPGLHAHVHVYACSARYSIQDGDGQQTIIVCSRWGGRHTRVNNFRIHQAMKSIKLLMDSPPLSESNHTSKSFLSLREVIVPRISIEFNGHTNCHKNAMIITSRTKFAHANNY